MSQDAAAEPTVVDWAEPDEPEPGGRFGAALATLRRDRRVLLTAAGLAAVALVASLIGEWQVTTVTPDASTVDLGADSTTQRLAAGIGGIGTWGAGYLMGIFLAVAGAAVVLFGPAAGRAQVRLATLGGCGALLALLVAAWNDLGQRSAMVTFIGGGGPSLTLAHGRGISAAIVGTLLLGGTLFLAGDLRVAPPAAGPPAAEPTERPADQDLSVWRPRRSAPAEDERPEEPLDLTVTPVAPFTTPPHRRTQA